MHTSLPLFFRKIRIKLLIPSLAFTFSSCLVGPNYQPPMTIAPDVFQESLGECEGQNSVCIDDADFFQWWKRFDDDLLNDLLCEAAQRNYDLQIAVEKICQARGQFITQSTLLLPKINFDSIVTRSRNSEAITGERVFGPTFQNFYMVGFDAIWEIDVFGRLERNRRAALYNWQSSVEQARNVQIIVLSEVARIYVLIRGLQKRVDIASQIVQADRAQLLLSEDRFRAGLNSCIDVETYRALLNTDIALLENLESTLQQSIYSLGILVGQPPAWIAEKFITIESIPESRGKIPAGLPSELLRRRHDIQSAERQLASATELIGAAIAQLFPQISLTSTNLFGARSQSSNLGWASTEAKNLFKPISKTWSVGPALFLPLLDWGSRLANISIETSLQKQAFLTYEKTVITAFQEVEEALVAYFKEEERQAALKAEVEANQRALHYTLDLAQSGLANCTQVWEAQKTWLSSESMLADSEQALTTDLIALYKALGGDWECFYSL